MTGFLVFFFVIYFIFQRNDTHYIITTRNCKVRIRSLLISKESHKEHNFDIWRFEDSMNLTCSSQEKNRVVSSIGAGLEYMTSQNGGQDGRHGSKMADSNPRWRPDQDKGHDL